MALKHKKVLNSMLIMIGKVRETRTFIFGATLFIRAVLNTYVIKYQNRRVAVLYANKYKCVLE